MIIRPADTDNQHLNIHRLLKNLLLLRQAANQQRATTLNCPMSSQTGYGKITQLSYRIRTSFVTTTLGMIVILMCLVVIIDILFSTEWNTQCYIFLV